MPDYTGVLFGYPTQLVRYYSSKLLPVVRFYIAALKFNWRNVPELARNGYTKRSNCNEAKLNSCGVEQKIKSYQFGTHYVLVILH